MKKKQKAIFLDRDGVINRNFGYVHKIEDFEFLPGVLEALKDLAETDYKILVITNQSGIGRGYYEEKQMHSLNDYMVEKIEKAGGRIDKIYFCPHRPDEECDCRKPNTAMIEKAEKDFELNLKECFLVGDKETDVETGLKKGLKTVKIGDDAEQTKADLSFSSLLDFSLEQSLY